MQVEQMIYTSCPTGLGAGAGFQTQAKSPGLTDADRFELEKIAAYCYPRCLPTNPTPHDIEKCCPPNLQSAELASGALRVTRSVYVGVDYSGRHGNYLAHSIVLPTQIRHWPVDLAYWKGWYETAPNTPPNLESLDPGEVFCSAEVFSFASLSEFLQEDRTRQESLRRMVHALLISRKTHRPLLIRHAADELPLWVACILKCIPLTVEKPFSFATFVNTLSAGLDLQCTTPESDLRLTEDDCRFTAYVFDFANDRASAVDVPEHSYACLIVEMLVNNPDGMKSFHKFAEKFSVTPTAENMLHLWNCYILCVETTASRKLKECSVQEELKFAGISLNKSDGCETLLKLIPVAVSQAKQESPKGTRLSVGRELQAILDHGFGAEVDRMVWKGCSGLLLAELSSGEDWQALHDIVAAIALRLGIKAETVREKLFDRASLSALLGTKSKDSNVFDRLIDLLLGYSPQDKTRFYLQDSFMWQCLQIGVDVGNADICVPAFVMRAGRTMSPGDFATLCHQLKNRFDSNGILPAVGKGVVALMNSESQPQRKHVRQSLAERQCHDVLTEELHLRMNGINEDMPGFLSYCDELDGRLFRQANGVFTKALQTGWEKTSGTRRELLCKWFCSHTAILSELNRNIQLEVASSLTENISLDPRDRDSASRVKMLTRLAKTLKVELIPERLAIRQFLIDLNRGKISTIKQFDGSWNDLQVHIDTDTGSDVVSLSMARLIQMCRSETEHYWALAWCCSIADDGFVAKEYHRFMTAKSSRNLTPEAANALVLAALKSDDKNKSTKHLAAIANRELDEWLYRLNKSAFRELLPRTTDVAAKLPDGLKGQWKRRYAQVESQRKSMFVCIRRLFQNLFSEKG